jgi:hypothetical protein
MFILSVICLSITTPLIELFLWIFPFMEVLQFPTRFFVPLCFLLTVILIISLSHLSLLSKPKNIFLSVIVLLVFNTFQYVPLALQSLSSDVGLSKPFLMFQSIRPTGILAEGDMYPIMHLTNRQVVVDDYKSSPTTDDKNATITNYTKNGSHIELSVTTQQSPTWLLLPLIYYPGYTVESDSQTKLSIGRTQSGLVQIHLPENETVNLKIKYGLSLATKLGIISTIIGLGSLLFVAKRRYSKTSQNS